MRNIKRIAIFDFDLENGKQKPYLHLYYETFGLPLGTAPVIVVNHSLTSNSSVGGEKGWWKEIVGEDKAIDTNLFTIIAFNVPGNGYGDPEANLIDNYRDFSIRDVARIFWEALFFLDVNEIYAVIGVSLGGTVAWEMAALQPDKIENLVPIATDWKATDWVIANVLIQDQILNNSKNPIADARMHATLLYHSPTYISQLYEREETDEAFSFKIEEWLADKGSQLQSRYQLAAYKFMNHLLKTNDVTRNRNDITVLARRIESNIHLVTIDTDYLFTTEECDKTYQKLRSVKQNVFYNQIQSEYGHDAFLMDFDQLSSILRPILNNQLKQNYVNL